jgi:hypothetical protein
VIAGGKLVGLAFSGITGSQNISYIIPTEEIELFLRDVSDGRYDGKPYIFDEYQTLENSALRTWLKLDKGVTGIVVRHPYEGAMASPLKEWDVITKIGDASIDDQGMVRVGDTLRVRFPYLAQSLSVNGKVPLTVVRAGKTLTVQAPVYSERAALVRDLKGSYPQYFIYGPLVFSTASTQFLVAAAGRIGILAAAGNPLLSRFSEAPDADQEEFVVVTAPLFTHRVSVGYESTVGSVVESVNGTHIKSLSQLVAVLRDLKDEFVIIRFNQRGGENLVFNRADLLAANEEILTDNGIRAQGSADMIAIWQGKSAAR